MAFKTTDLAELKKMDEKSLRKELAAVEIELAKRRLHIRSGEDKKSHTVQILRKQIARIKTLAHKSPSNAI